MLLGQLGYRRVRGGKTAGSRRRFAHESAPAITLHKPHPGNIVKVYALRAVARFLTEAELL